MRNKNLKGTGVALITPFNRDNSIDFDSLKKLINHLIKNQIDYLVVMGTTGESAVLTFDEQNEVINYVKKIVNNRLPIIVGIGGNDTIQVVNKIKSFDFNGIEAILSVCPYYNKPSQSGIFAHYSKLSKVSPVDIILYNVPSRTSVNMSVETVVSLAENCQNIVGIKEASGNIEQCMDLFSSCPDDFMIISGDDKMTFPIMLLGGVGVISVQAMALPSLFSKMVQSTLSGNIDLARKCHYELLKSVDLFYVNGNPSGIKEALYQLKICSSNQVRLPLVPMNAQYASKLNFQIQNTLSNKK
ncbi:MAG: 4-hydroxy-tetrahydrodipicolinate synthase [Flavobacteriales bacterium]|nr:4-hydroxy-tetrahydrodipicolinate synthase [Flavobacteriales bacterium]|tara:strand:- start:7315 stop:8214 length:900 start_codon:yes stop_codon:yes gene_type:complete